MVLKLKFPEPGEQWELRQLRQMVMGLRTSCICEPALGQRAQKRHGQRRAHPLSKLAEAGMADAAGCHLTQVVLASEIGSKPHRLQTNPGRDELRFPPVLSHIPSNSWCILGRRDMARLQTRELSGVRPADLYRNREERTPSLVGPIFPGNWI